MDNKKKGKVEITVKEAMGRKHKQERKEVKREEVVGLLLTPLILYYL